MSNFKALKLIYISLIVVFIFTIFSSSTRAKTIEIEINDDLQKIINSFKGITISGQAAMTYQTSNLNLDVGDLKNSSGNNLTANELSAFNHKDGAGSFFANLTVKKEFNDNELFQIDIQFANGRGVDANLQGGVLVNSDIKEDPNNHNHAFLAQAFYERIFNLPKDYNLTFDIGKFAVNNFFDIAHEANENFLNQAIINNGAFDYAQDLESHGYTYGSRVGLANNFIGFDLGFFSSDSYLDNINDKHSIVAAITLTPTLGQNLAGQYQIYVFSNKGEYAAFNSNGDFLTKNIDTNSDGVIDGFNSENNIDSLNKNGFGINIIQNLSDKIGIFSKYGKQDDDRDVRHYQDQDESFMVGVNFNGAFWSRSADEIGIAYQLGRLTGNHRKAHEKGYNSHFNRTGGIGVGNYGDESVIEAYYKLVFGKNTSLIFDAQHISNFYYSKKIGTVNFFAVRFQVFF